MIVFCCVLPASNQACDDVTMSTVPTNVKMALMNSINSCSPDQQKARKESDRDEVEDCREDGLHRRDDEAAMYHKLTKCR